MKYTQLLACLGLALIAFSCKSDYTILDPEVPDPLDNIQNPLRFSDTDFEVLSQELLINQEIDVPLPVLPNHLNNSQRVLEFSPTQMRRATLGRVLFYDTRLSATGETSCATCHQQKFAFGDDKAFSDGIRGGHTERNSFALGGVPSFLTRSTNPTNSASALLGYYMPPPPNTTAVDAKFFWDGRAKSIGAQTLETMSNPVEMGTDLETITDKLYDIPMYRVLARKAFRNERLAPGQIVQAISEFMAAMSSTDSRFDDLMDMIAAGAEEEELLQHFTASELRGKAISDLSCGPCHTDGNRNRIEMANNGLGVHYPDKGRGEFTGEAAMNGVFKIPFLRNLPLTGPYMHDGSLQTLRDVVDHYSDHLAPHPNLHPLLKNEDGSPRRLHLSEADKQALVDFLEMTKDRSIETAEHMSDPFRR